MICRRAWKHGWLCEHGERQLKDRRRVRPHFGSEVTRTPDWRRRRARQRRVRCGLESGERDFAHDGFAALSVVGFAARAPKSSSGRRGEGHWCALVDTAVFEISFRGSIVK